MKKIIIGIFVFFTAWILIHVLIMLAVGLNTTTKPADAIVIYGSKVETTGEVSKRLKGRLDEGLRLYEQGLAPLIVVSGGFGKEGYDEALVMKDYLVERDVPVGAIIADQDGYTTYKTGENLKEIAVMEDIKSVIAVSQYHHVLRAKMTLSRFGFEPVYSSYARMFEVRDLYSVPREEVAYYAYLFKEYE